MLTKNEIRSYWEGRASGDLSAQSTTQDVYLREIELRELTKQIKRLMPTNVVDIGCGDGRTTIGIAKNLTSLECFGFDYSDAMVKNARANLTKSGLSNVAFECHDICSPPEMQFDLAYTTRCLINLPQWELQQAALRNIHRLLQTDGHYLMIENFIDGQENFNSIRRDFGLPEISVRDHNLFFERGRLLKDIENLFLIEEEVNISSTYYMISRIVYSRICLDMEIDPNYFDDHHRYAAGLPYAGEYGPVRLLVLKKI